MRSIAAILCLGLAACSSGPDDTRSFRQSVADWIAPEGHTAPAGSVQAPGQVAPMDDARIREAYAADAARLEAGGRAIAVSQVTVWGGRVNVPTSITNSDWRESGGVVTVTVAECQSVPMVLQRADKRGSATIYATRVAGIVHLAPWAGQGCRPPAQAVSVPGSGQFPLTVQGRVQGATVRVEPWGSSPAYIAPPRW